MATTALVQLRWVALLEGVSFLLLLLAMPVKYLLDQPIGVKVLGPIHGILFVGFVVALIRVATEHEWRLSRSVFAFVSSLIPFGTFVLDRALKREIEALRAQPATAATTPSQNLED